MTLWLVTPARSGAATYAGTFNAPILRNSNFFMTLESMKILRVLTDVWCPTSSGSGRCAMTLAKTPWYWETVTCNIALLADWREDFSIRRLVGARAFSRSGGTVLPTKFDLIVNLRAQPTGRRIPRIGIIQDANRRPQFRSS